MSGGEAKNKAELASMLMDYTDMLTPIFDAAEGMRADLERRGFSPTAAESVANEWLMSAMRFIWQQQSKATP